MRFFDFANNHQFQHFNILEMVSFGEYLESQNLQVQFIFLIQNGMKLQIWVFEIFQRIDDFKKRENPPTLVFNMLLV